MVKQCYRGWIKALMREKVLKKIEFSLKVWRFGTKKKMCWKVLVKNAKVRRVERRKD